MAIICCCFSGRAPLLSLNSQVLLILIYIGEFRYSKFPSCWCDASHVKIMTFQLRRNHGRKIYGSFNRETKTPQILKLAVTGVTELLRLFSPSHQTRSLSLSIYANYQYNPQYHSILCI